LILGLQLLLAIAYAALAHLSTHHDDPRIAVAALVVLVLLVLVQPLARRALWAWLSLPLCALAIGWLFSHGLVAVPLLLVPVAFIAMVSWWFARSLRPGSIPLITRIACAMEATSVDELGDDLRRYTRALTAAWAWLLAGLAVINLLLAMISVPNGLLAELGVLPPVTISQTQWSWFANILNYGIMGGFFVLEYNTRKRRFPGSHRNFIDFLRRMSALGPAFWKDFLR